MLDLRFIRENTGAVEEALKNRQDSAPIDRILQLDTERRQKILELEGLRHTRKESARERKVDKASAEEARDLRSMIRDLEEEVKELDSQLEELLLQVPNIPHPSVPVGKDEDDNVSVRTWGEPKKFDFTPAPHWKLGETLDIIDFERGVKLSGTRFYVLKGLGARLQRALIWFMVDLRLSGNLPAIHGETRVPCWLQPAAQIRRQPLPRFRGRLLVRAHGGGAVDKPPPR
jgi:seryl-tRNA synthetase